MRLSICSRRSLASGILFAALLAAPEAVRAQISIPGGPQLPIPGGGQFPTPGGPQIVFDPRNLIENLEQVAQTLNQINNQRLQIQYQLQALAKLKNPNWREMIGLMNQLDALMRQGEALAYSVADLDEQFRRTFPGYKLPKGWIASEMQRTQTTRALATLQASLATTRRQMQDVEPGLMRLAEIKRQMSSIEGTQEAIEMQNTLQAYVAEELTMLRQAAAVQTNVASVVHAQEIQREMQEQAVLDHILRNTLTRPRTISAGFDGRWRRP